MVDIQMTSIETFEEAEAFWRWLGERREGSIALDTETEGLHWWKDKIRLVQVGDANHGWSMRWDRWSGLVEQMFKVYDRRVVMHNFKFDTEFLRHNDVHPPVNMIDDTRTMAHLIDPDRRTGLKPLADELLGRGMSDGQDQLGKMMRAHKWDWKTIPYDVPIYWQYAALDTVLTARIYDRLDHDMGEYRELYDMEMAAQIAIMDMEIRGARIDIDYSVQKANELRDWANEVREWAQREHGINISSGQQLAKVMMADGWEPKKFTNSGQPQMTKEVLEHVDHPLAKLSADLKHAEKMASSYFDNFLELEDGGFLHAKINPLGARTGRMSVTDPALQTLPRDALVRDAFIPREGNKLLLIDYDQMEVRLGAHFFGDERMIHDIMTQDDVHTYVGCQIFGTDTITKQQRQITKNAVYAILYNAGIATFAKTAGIPETEAKSFMRAYNEMYPGIRVFKKQLEQEAQNDRMWDGRVRIKTPYGRVQPVWDDKEYKLINYLIQGTGADVLKHKIAELSAAGLDEFMILPVHDEIMFDVPEDIVEDVKKEAEDIMTAKQFRVPLTVDAKIVERWGDAYRKV
jgi:DNA polymerase-1